MTLREVLALLRTSTTVEELDASGMTTSLKLKPSDIAALKWVLRWDGTSPMPSQHIAAVARLDYLLNPELHTLTPEGQ